jgi:glucan endo-1,3-alpha-glucosidase
MFWVVVFSTAPATMTLFTASGSDEKSVDVRAGVTKLSHALKVNGGMGARMERGGKVVAECNPSGFTFQAKPSVYNFNVFVAMSE